MNDHRSDSVLTDAALDREIEIALAVDPSPDFEARVRLRVASAPAPTPFWMSWKSMTAGATVVAVVAAAVVLRPREKTVVAPVPQTAASRAAQAVEPVAQTANPVAQASRPGGTRLNKRAAIEKRAAVSSTSRTEPDVLLDAREAEALNRLLAGVREGRFDLTPLAPANVEAASELKPPTDIVIPPLSTDPLTPVQGEGVRQ